MRAESAKGGGWSCQLAHEIHYHDGRSTRCITASTVASPRQPPGALVGQPPAVAESPATPTCDRGREGRGDATTPSSARRRSCARARVASAVKRRPARHPALRAAPRCCWEANALVSKSTRRRIGGIRWVSKVQFSTGRTTRRAAPPAPGQSRARGGTANQFICTPQVDRAAPRPVRSAEAVARGHCGESADCGARTVQSSVGRQARRVAAQGQRVSHAVPESSLASVWGTTYGCSQAYPIVLTYRYQPIGHRPP